MKKEVVIDTDVYNEIDDMWALSYLLNSEDDFCLKGICIAPFDNFRADSVQDGVEKSYNSALELLKLNHKERYSDIVFKGASSFLTIEQQPIDSPAVRHLIKEANLHSKENPLYVIAIAAITNVASALKIAPEIEDKIVIVWLAGQCYSWPRQDEFNLTGDLLASQTVLNSNAPLVLLPCMGVVSGFHSSEPELRYWLEGKNELCDFLIDQTVFFRTHTKPQDFPCSIVLWDVSAVAYLVSGSECFMCRRVEPRPTLNDDLTYSFHNEDRTVTYIYFIERDYLMKDLFDKLANVK